MAPPKAYFRASAMSETCAKNLVMIAAAVAEKNANGNGNADANANADEMALASVHIVN